MDRDRLYGNILYAFLACIILISLPFMLGIYPMHDEVVLPDQMSVKQKKTDDGYLLTVTDCGDYNCTGDWMYGFALNSSIQNSKPLDMVVWEIWDSPNRRTIETGLLINNTKIEYNDTNSNMILDVGDTILIINPSHSYGSYYFIMRESSIDERFAFLHVEIR